MRLSWKGQGLIRHGDIALEWYRLSDEMLYIVRSLRSGKRLLQIYIHDHAWQDTQPSFYEKP